MGDNSGIEWTDATWNPITGCSVVSAGCTHCYAMKLAGGRLQHEPTRIGLTRTTNGGPVWTGEVRFNESMLGHPLRWGRPRKIFVCAHGDLFHESVPDAWIDRVFAVMALAPQHTFQVLTKRADRMRRYLEGVSRHRIAAEAFAFSGKQHPQGHGCDPDVCNIAWPLANVWLGVSVEHQDAADERIPHLLATPAAVRWISAEPLLGPVNLRWTPYAHQANGESYRQYLDRQGSVDQYEALRKLDWIVVGGESGVRARPMHPDWARSLRDQCAEAQVPFLFKQWGEWSPQAPLNKDGTLDLRRQSVLADNGVLYDPLDIAPGGLRYGEALRAGADKKHLTNIYPVGKKVAGRQLDGVEHNGYAAARA